MLNNYYFSHFHVHSKLNVYILDGTVNLDHQEFSHLKTKVKLGGETGINNHATAVAGVIVGKTIGVIRDPNIQLYNYAVCAGGYCIENQIWNGIIAVKKHLKESRQRGVINLSFGVYCGDDCGEYDSYFEEILSLGGIIVSASGNDESDACEHDPQGSSKVIGVGNYDSQWKRSPNSNYGDCIDTWAPGDHIYSSFWNGYGWMSGTSMSAPAVMILQYMFLYF